MPIPVYQALTFEREMVGGRNHPWLLTVQADRGIDAYVTKFFAQEDIDQHNALNKEIYVCVLAEELGVSTPDFALITVDDSFKSTLSEEKRKQLESSHNRFGFGSKFLDGAYTYSPALHTKELADYDIESIFAFDVLIRNVDRRDRKPNILLDEEWYYLIDHELSMALPMEGLQPRQYVAGYPFSDHIFHKTLSRKAIYGHKPDFATFQEHFRRLNCDVLDPYASLLNEKGYETDDSLVIKRYLEELKQDISYFMNILKGGIQ